MMFIVFRRRRKLCSRRKIPVAANSDKPARFRPGRVKIFGGMLMAADSTEINFLLDQYRDGQPEGFEKLMALVYDDLRKLAAWHLQSERRDHTLQPTALVHEVYLKLAAQNPVEWQNKAHFFAMAAQVMRHILVDYARTRQRNVAARRRDRAGGRAQTRLSFRSRTDRAR